MRELIQEANFEVSGTGISLQAMDSSHVSLVAMNLRSDGFEHYRCDRSFSMGAWSDVCLQAREGRAGRALGGGCLAKA